MEEKDEGYYPEDGWFVKPETSGVAANLTEKNAIFGPEGPI